MGSKIPRFELSTVHLYQHYSLFMPNNSSTFDVGIIVCSVCQTPRLTEVRAPSLLEQHPQYVPHRDRAG